MLAGGKLAWLDRRFQELVGIHRYIVDSYFVVQVWASAASTETDITNYLSTPHALPARYRKGRQVAVTGLDAISVINLDHAAISAEKIRVVHDAVRWRQHWLSVVAGNVHAGVERAFAVEWANAFAEGPCNRTHDWPQRRRGGRIYPVRERRLMCEPHAQSSRGRTGYSRAAQGVQLVDGVLHLFRLNRPVGILQKLGIAFQPVDDRHLVRQRA